LFNLGSITSQIAEVQNRSSAEGAKKACHFFQLAAGTFDHLKDYLQQRPHQASTPDLTTELLTILVNLMLAQAQECFCEKVNYCLHVVICRLTNSSRPTKMA